MLNDEQKSAVQYNKGPLLIIAGAGTGKTTVIVEKIKYLLKENLAKPEEILALTFTEKAAYEMEERVDKEIPYGYFQMSISTFHAFAEQVLKEHGSHIGISPGFRLMTEAETIIFLRKNLFLFNLEYFRPLGNPSKFLGAMLDHFSRLKDEEISPDDYDRFIKNQKNRIKNIDEKTEIEKNQELSHAYRIYQSLKIKEGVFDFSDLTYYQLMLFRKRANILKKYRERFKYILVDEFQDTNIAQYELIKLLAPSQSKPKLTVVGDDSQAIYKFRGASVSNILNFMKDYPRSRQVTLKKNYRSNQTILDRSYMLIKNNDPDTLESKLGISKNLQAHKSDDKDSIGFFLGDKVEQEADFVVKQIIQLKKNLQYSDFAILCRANNHAEPFIRALTRSGIPYQFLGPGMLLKQPEIKDLIAYLKTLYNIEDSISFYRVLTMDIFKIEPRDISLLLTFSKKTNTPLFLAAEIYLSFLEKDIYKSDFEIYKKHLPLLSTNTKNQLLKIYKMVKKHLGLLKKESAGQILYYFLEETKYLNKLVTYKTEKEEKTALNVSKFFNKLKNFEAEHEDASVFAVVDFLEMSLELGESPIVSQTDLSLLNAVNILTAHSAKGLEFPVVFMVNLTRGRFPTYEKKEVIPIPQKLIKEILPEGDPHLQEERRLFYVGMTRSKDKLFFTSSRFYGEGKRRQKLSPFVIETLGNEYLDKYEKISIENKQQLSIFDFKKNEEPIAKVLTDKYLFSYTQLESYDRCPLQYKYQFVLKLPTSPTASLSFGDTIHKTLQTFYQQFTEDKNIGQNEILQIFKNNWSPLGYSSQTHEKQMKKEGEKMLKKYLIKFHNPKIKTIDLEKLFRIKIDKKTSLVGKMDRVDELKEGRIEIIDYKTGKKPDEKTLKKSFQLSIYALAASDPGLYRKKLNQVDLTFYFLQDMEKVTLVRNKDEILSTKKDIIKKAEEIRSSKFEPHVGRWCDYCAFRMICEAWQ